MLELSIPPHEMWDEKKQEFIEFKGAELVLEHSLVSISKWESEFCKPFLSKNGKTEAELRAYVRCMTINKGVDSWVYKLLTPEQLNKVMEYIDAPMSAVKFKKDKGGRPSRETITSELIYYWMIACNIPSAYEKWHLNRLMNLIKICNIKNTPPKKRSKSEILSQQAALNAERRARLHTTG